MPPAGRWREPGAEVGRDVAGLFDFLVLGGAAVAGASAAAAAGAGEGER